MSGRYRGAYGGSGAGPASAGIRHCARCGGRIVGYDYRVRNGLPVHDGCDDAQEAGPGPRVILAITFDGEEYAKALADSLATKERRQNVRVARQKIYAERTWRWGHAIVADATQKPGEG